MNTWTQRQRRRVAWFCAAVALLMPWEAQLHGLWHARQAVHEAKQHTDPLPHTAKVCEQCLLFTALDAAVPSRALSIAVGDEALPTPKAVAQPWHAFAFTAYQTRAPPRRT
jgi:hypothetical protein